ncbi:VanW family protein [Paraclostridium sordellii]|uniref:VanW family protein n=1 Tax=Paraclostridium sordellii TaxID=1505 RepID=UPI0005E75EFE|nr:VanW family protein [Paeniclostridium sordellii]QYE97191.1 VanW family protein [Paeniclostridium sordellii]CEP81398.1 vancomycin resistance protein [[Clostridium] sordellii] [Paeniclostridium sordellii]
MEQNISIEEHEDSVKLNKNTKKYIILLIIFFAITIIGIIWFNNTYIHNGKIANNIYIGSINVSNLSKEEAKKLVEQKYTPKDIGLEYEANKFVLQPKDINLSYDIGKIVNESYEFNKSDSFIKNLKRTITLQLGNEKVFEVKGQYNEEMLNNYVEKIEKNINKDAIDAKLYVDSNGSINLIPSVIGQTLDLSKTSENIKKSINDNSSSQVKLIVTKNSPKITTDMLKSVDSVLASHSTTYNNSSPNRAHNIIKAAQSTNDIILMPGEEFSYNKATGPRSKANGYKDAAVIVNGKIQNGPGGGVCQVSTTIYNSVLYSGLEITQVRNHSLPSSYAPMGKDATVAYDYLDLKFKNPYKNPIYIYTTAYNGVVSSKIYGSSIDKKNINIVVERYGNTVKTYRVFKDKSGHAVKNEYISTSTYDKK